MGRSKLKDIRSGIRHGRWLVAYWEAEQYDMYEVYMRFVLKQTRVARMAAAHVLKKKLGLLLYL